jgi:hypothetical protein
MRVGAAFIRETSSGLDYFIIIIAKVGGALSFFPERLFEGYGTAISCMAVTSFILMISMTLGLISAE